MKVYIVFEAENTGTGFRGASEVLGVFTDENAAETLRQQRTNQIRADIDAKLSRGFYLKPETAFDRAEFIWVETHELT